MSCASAFVDRLDRQRVFAHAVHLPQSVLMARKTGPLHRLTEHRPVLGPDGGAVARLARTDRRFASSTAVVRPPPAITAAAPMMVGICTAPPEKAAPVRPRWRRPPAVNAQRPFAGDGADTLGLHASLPSPSVEHPDNLERFQVLHAPCRARTVGQQAVTGHRSGCWPLSPRECLGRGRGQPPRTLV